MAKDLKRVNKGQAPSLLDSIKANEVIDAINHLRQSKSTSNASASGFTLKTNSEGAIELDVTQSTANAIEEARELNENPLNTMTFTTVENGRYQNITFYVV